VKIREYLLVNNPLNMHVSPLDVSYYDWYGPPANILQIMYEQYIVNELRSECSPIS
jgi:hypothetical protein